MWSTRCLFLLQWNVELDNLSSYLLLNVYNKKVLSQIVHLVVICLRSKLDELFQVKFKSSCIILHCLQKFTEILARSVRHMPLTPCQWRCFNQKWILNFSKMIKMSCLVLHSHAYDVTLRGAKNMLNAEVVISIDLSRLEYEMIINVLFKFLDFANVVWWFNLNV